MGAARHLPRCLIDRVECPADGGDVRTPRVGKQQLAGAPVEQLDVQKFFQRSDGMADGRRCDMHFVSCELETHMPRGGLEGAQCRKWRKDTFLGHVA